MCLPSVITPQNVLPKLRHTQWKKRVSLSNSLSYFGFLPRAESQITTWVQVDYLEGNSKKHKQGCGEGERPRREKSQYGALGSKRTYSPSLHLCSHHSSYHGMCLTFSLSRVGTQLHE